MRHELPHAAGAGAAIERPRLKARLGHGEIDEILRHALFSHHPLDHRLVPAGALKRVQQRVVALLSVGKKVDVRSHIVVHHQRQIGLGRGQVRPGLGHKVRINLEGHVARHFGRRRLNLGHKPVPLFQRLHLQRIDPVHNAIELLLQTRIAPDIDPACEHQVHRAIELYLGLGQIPLAIVRRAVGVGLLHLLDQQVHALLFARGRRRQCGCGGLRCLRRPWQRWRGDLRLRSLAICKRLRRIAPRQRKRQQGRTKQTIPIPTNAHERMRPPRSASTRGRHYADDKLCHGGNAPTTA